MGGETTDATISGAKDAGGNAVFPPPPHMSISLAPSSGLSPPSDDVTAAYIRLLQRRDDERDNELAALRAEVAQMKQRMQLDDTPATSRSGGGGRGPRRTPPPPPPPPPQERPHETHQRGSVKDRLGFTPETGDAREIILYKKPTASGNHPPKSTHDRTRTRDSESFTSTYSTGLAEFSRTTVSHRSRGSADTRRHVSERLEDILPENQNDEAYARRKGREARTEGKVDDPKIRRNKEKTIDGPRRAQEDLRDKLRRREEEKSHARESKRSKSDEHGKPPRPGFERQLKDLGISPFTSHIINTPPEHTFHLPKFTKFDPSTCEAYTHLIHFRQTIELCTLKDEVKCKAFPSSLGSLGLQWFNKLPAGSIKNLADLERAFNTRFITSNRTAKEPESLSQLRKLPNESLRQYSERYWQLFNEIPGIDEYWAARTFKNGLESGSKILDELAIRPPHGMDELMRVVERFCALEEFYADRAAQGIPNPNRYTESYTLKNPNLWPFLCTFSSTRRRA